MPNPSADSLKGRIARLEGELDELRSRNDDLTQEVAAAQKREQAAVAAGEERAEEDAGRINSLKAICAEKDQKLASLEGYIKRVHEEDDSTSPLGEKQPAPEVPRTRLARENGHTIRIPDGGWVSMNERDSRQRHWSSIWPMTAPSPAAALPPSAAPAPRSGLDNNPSGSQPIPRPERGEFSITFRGEGEHEALRAAEAWLKARGFSIGTMQADAPRGIMLGDVMIAKWRNLDAEDRADLHGQMSARAHTWRSGPIRVDIRPDAPSAIIEAFNLTDEDLVDRAAQAKVEARE